MIQVGKKIHGFVLVASSDHGVIGHGYFQFSKVDHDGGIQNMVIKTKDGYDLYIDEQDIWEGW